MSRDRGVGGATCRRLRHGRSIVVEVSVHDVTTDHVSVRDVTTIHALPSGVCEGAQPTRSRRPLTYPHVNL